MACLKFFLILQHWQKGVSLWTSWCKVGQIGLRAESMWSYWKYNNFWEDIAEIYLKMMATYTKLCVEFWTFWCYIRAIVCATFFITQFIVIIIIIIIFTTIYVTQFILIDEISSLGSIDFWAIRVHSFLFFFPLIKSNFLT